MTVMRWIALYNAQKLELRKLNAAILRKNAKIARLKNSSPDKMTIGETFVGTDTLMIHTGSMDGIEDSSPEEGEGRRGDAPTRGRALADMESNPSRALRNPYPPGNTGPAAGVASGPLTPAEKMRAYRERLKKDPKLWEAYKEANRLRMKRDRERKRK